jgi:hypothetical protein
VNLDALATGGADWLDGPLTLAADALLPCSVNSQPIGLLRDRGAARNFSSALFGFHFYDGFCGGTHPPLE